MKRKGIGPKTRGIPGYRPKIYKQETQSKDMAIY